MVLCSAPKFRPHPGGSYGGQGGLSFYVGAKRREWSQISHRKLNRSISHGVVVLASEPDAMLTFFRPKFSLFDPHFIITFTCGFSQKAISAEFIFVFPNVLLIIITAY